MMLQMYNLYTRIPNFCS